MRLRFFALLLYTSPPCSTAAPSKGRLRDACLSAHCSQLHPDHDTLGEPRIAAADRGSGPGAVLAPGHQLPHARQHPHEQFEGPRQCLKRQRTTPCSNWKPTCGRWSISSSPTRPTVTSCRRHEHGRRMPCARNTWHGWPRPSKCCNWCAGTPSGRTSWSPNGTCEEPQAQRTGEPARATADTTISDPRQGSVQLLIQGHAS